MKFRYPLIVAVLVLGWVNIPLRAGPPDTTTQPTPTTGPGKELAQHIEAIRNATDPSAVVTALAKGLGVDDRSVKLYEAYIRRMIDFSLPGLCYRQARTLVELDPDNGLGWGVLAHVNAERGNVTEALSAMVLAVEHLPDDPFVQRTGGQILAWYDSNPERPEIPEDIKKSLEKIRKDMGERKVFAEAYDEAKAFYAAQPVPDEQEAIKAETREIAPEPEDRIPPQITSYSIDVYYSLGTYGVAYVLPYYHTYYTFFHHPYHYYHRHHPHYGRIHHRRRGGFIFHHHPRKHSFSAFIGEHGGHTGISAHESHRRGGSLIIGRHRIPRRPPAPRVARSAIGHRAGTRRPKLSSRITPTRIRSNVTRRRVITSNRVRPRRARTVIRTRGTVTLRQVRPRAVRSNIRVRRTGARSGVTRGGTAPRVSGRRGFVRRGTTSGSLMRSSRTRSRSSASRSFPARPIPLSGTPRMISRDSRPSRARISGR